MNDHVVIVAAKRTPIGHFGGYYKNTPAPLLGAAVLEAIVKNINMPLKDIDEVLMGCVLSAGGKTRRPPQARRSAYLPSFLCDADACQWVRHPHHTGTSWTQRYPHHDGLYPRHYAGERRRLPAGWRY